MSITISDIQTNLNTYIGDTSTDRITADERIQAIGEAVVWLQEELGNDLQKVTSTLNYFDTVNEYKVTSTLADLLQSADLRRELGDHDQPFSHVSAREIYAAIGAGSTRDMWSIDRRNDDVYLLINHQTTNSAKTISDCDSTSSGGGTWELDTTNSDATNLTIDTNEKKQGTGSFNFDIDVSQSGNNKATIKNESLTQTDLSSYEDLGSWLFRAYIPDTTNFTSFTLYWGSDTSNYWSHTVTTDIDGDSFSDGWNRIKIDWEDATKTSSPDVDNIDYIQIDLNYEAGQGDDTDFRIDDIIIALPEQLTFHYMSWYVGTDTSGDDITTFSDTTDIPYFSGKYDNLRYPVAHKAASILFYTALRLPNEGAAEEGRAIQSLDRLQNIFPSARIQESHNFKVAGVNFNKK